jgi:hypothetical protein
MYFSHAFGVGLFTAVAVGFGAFFTQRKPRKEVLAHE